MFQKSGKYFSRLRKVVIIFSVLLLWGFQKAKSQESVRLPDNWIYESEKLDELLLKIDLAKGEYLQKDGQLKKEKEKLLMQRRMAAPGEAKEYYSEMIEQTNAELLFTKYLLKKEVRQFATEAKKAAGQLVRTVQTEDFGRLRIEEKIQSIEMEQISLEENILNHNIIKKYGKLTGDEIKKLETAKVDNAYLYRLWIREMTWYSELLSGVMKKSRYFKNAAQLIESVISDLNNVIQTVNSEIEAIKKIAHTEQELAIQRLLKYK